MINTLTKQEIVDTLKEKTCEVIFEKQNGEERRMIASLHPDYIEDYNFKGNGKTENENIVYAWDVLKSAFRAFNINKIKSFKPILK